MILKECRTCGKMYVACRDSVRDPKGSFRWQEVACSPECGTLYFKEILKARGEEVISKTSSDDGHATVTTADDDWSEDESVFSNEDTNDSED